MEEAKRNLSHVLWLGGMSCSGKTTISNILAEQYDLNVDHRDDYMANHFERVTPTNHPVMSEWKSEIANGVSKFDAFVRRETGFLELFSSMVREDFLMTLEDLSLLPKDKPLLVEGVRLPPESVYNLLSDTRNAVWLAPSRQFLQTYLPTRKNLLEVLEQYPDPEASFENLVSTYFESGRYLSESAAKLGLKVIAIEDAESVERSVEVISRHFRLQ